MAGIMFAQGVDSTWYICKLFHTCNICASTLFN